MIDPIKLGLYVLLFLPGFIFVQTRDYHLLREKKDQLERTLEIVLWSAIIWMVACAFPFWWPGGMARETALNGAKQVLQAGESNPSSSWEPLFARSSAFFFLAVCGWTIVAANLWGYCRKDTRVDSLVKFVSGRDWYPSVAFRFFKENVNKAVVVSVGDKRYLGILFSAPDTKEDKYIILTEASLLPNPNATPKAIEELPLVDSILIKFEEINEIQALKKDVLKTTRAERTKVRLGFTFGRLREIIKRWRSSK